MTMPPAAPDGILDNVKLYFWMFNKTLCLSESRIYRCRFYRCRDYTNSSDQNTDENELSHDNDNYGPLFKLHGDDADLWYI